MLTVANVTMTGSEVTYAIPSGTRRIHFRPPAANVTIATTASGATYTITASEVYHHVFDVNDWPQSLYLTGTTAQIVQVMLES